MFKLKCFYLGIIYGILCICSPLFSCQIIYLNGTSSVGKTTIARALQEEMENPYMLIGIDQLIYMMPEKVNFDGRKSELGLRWKPSKDAEGHPLQLLEMGPLGNKIHKAYRAIAHTLADQEFFLIIDDVAMDEGSFESWKSELTGYSVLWVGLTAPIDVIEKREKDRGDRQVGQARAAAAIVHKDFVYDLYLDTNALSTQEIIHRIKDACKMKQQMIPVQSGCQ